MALDWPLMTLLWFVGLGKDDEVEQEERGGQFMGSAGVEKVSRNALLA